MIENAFSKKQIRPKIAVESKVALENNGIQKCDKCEYETNKVVLLRDHIAIRHSEVKHKCTECDYQHHFPNRVRSHYKQVHMGIPRGDANCKSAQCPYFGTRVCLLLEEHALYQCVQCKFTAKRKFQLKHHVGKTHDGITFSCEQCKFSSAWLLTRRPA